MRDFPCDDDFADGGQGKVLQGVSARSLDDDLVRADAVHAVVKPVCGDGGHRPRPGGRGCGSGPRASASGRLRRPCKGRAARTARCQPRKDSARGVPGHRKTPASRRAIWRRPSRSAARDPAAFQCHSLRREFMGKGVRPPVCRCVYQEDFVGCGTKQPDRAGLLHQKGAGAFHYVRRINFIAFLQAAFESRGELGRRFRGCAQTDFHARALPPS